MGDHVLKGKWRTLKVLKFGAPPPTHRHHQDKKVKSRSKKRSQNWRLRVRKRHRRAQSRPHRLRRLEAIEYKQKGNPEEKIPGGRKQKGKTGMWRPKGGQPLTKVAEDDHDTRMSQYTTQTAKEGAWWLIVIHKDWEYDRYHDIDKWELVSGEWTRCPRNVKTIGAMQT